MSKRDHKLPTDEKRLCEIAEQTENPQLKRSIEQKMQKMSKDSTIRK